MVYRLQVCGCSDCGFQYSLCRVVLMVSPYEKALPSNQPLSVLALSSRFDGLVPVFAVIFGFFLFQYSLCRVVLMVLFCLSPLPAH